MTNYRSVNALAENFFATLKIELVYRCSWRTRGQAELALFRYIDGWYNSQRIQRGLSWHSPTNTNAEGSPWYEIQKPDSTKAGEHQTLRTAGESSAGVDTVAA